MSRSYLIAFIIAVAVAGWLASGLLTETATNSTQESTSAITDETIGETLQSTTREPLAVRVRVLVAELHPQLIVARGRTEEGRMVDLKAEVNGRVMAVAVAKGAQVGEGDIIVQLDVRNRTKQLTEAEATLKQRQMEYDAAEALQAKGFRADTETAKANAFLKIADAHLSRIQLELARTNVRAPFDGVVEERFVELGDYVHDGDPVARIVDQDPLLVVAQVTEREVRHLAVGDHGEAKIITGEHVTGSLRYIATKAEERTRTFRIELEIPNTNLKLRAGLTAELRVTIDSVPAHFISPAVLTLNEEGIVGVKLVTLDSRVEFYPAEIVADTADGIWIGGLPATATVITVGQEYVQHGDYVRPVTEAAQPTL